MLTHICSYEDTFGCENALLSIQHLKSNADFLKAKTVDRVKKHLNVMDNEIKKKLKYAAILRTA